MNLVPVGLNKSSDKLEKEIIRREVYDELVKKVNAIQTTDIGNLVKKLTIISKTNEVEKSILDHGQETNKFLLKIIL